MLTQKNKINVFCYKQSLNEKLNVCMLKLINRWRKQQLNILSRLNIIKNIRLLNVKNKF